MSSSPKRLTIAVMWEKFLAEAIPPNAPPEQITEMRTAFYTGFWSCFHQLTTAGLDEGTEATEADLAYLDSLLAELQAWIQEYGGGDLPPPQGTA